jgi:hypothetical protein
LCKLTDIGRVFYSPGIYSAPDPANGLLAALDVPAGSTYRMLNRTGVVFQSARLMSEKQQISISKLSPGLYLLQVEGV